MAKTLTGIGYTTQNQIDYRKQLESILNNKKKEFVRQQQQEIIKVYEKAYKDIIEKGLKKAGGDKAKIDKLTKVYAEQIYNELELIVKQYNADMSSTIETMQAEIMMSMNIFEKGDYYEFKEAVDKAVNVTNRKVVQQMIEGKVYHDGKGLDKRIWDSAKMSGTKMRDAINSCIAQGMGAADMSQNLKEFAMGGHHTWSRNKIREKLGDGYARKYGSGGLDYEALRLARTTLTHQAQIAVINSSKINPYLQFVKWHSDHQAGRTCQQCIDRDGQLFKIDEVPLDHPNGMCWIQPVYSIDGKTEATPEEIAKDMKAWAAGEKNSKRMDKIPEYEGLGGKAKKVAKPKPARWQDYMVKDKKDDRKEQKESNTKPKTNKPASWKDYMVKQEPNKPKLKASARALYTQEQRDAKYADLKTLLNKQIAKNDLGITADSIINHLKQAPDYIQDMYLTVGKPKFKKDPNHSCYMPGQKSILTAFTKTGAGLGTRLKFGDNHRHDVLMHEWAHLIDYQHKPGKYTMKYKGVSMYSARTVKSNLGNSLLKDVEAWKKNNNGNDSKFSQFLLSNEKYTLAIQDGIRGMTKGKVQVRWGHDLNYYHMYKKGKITADESTNIVVSGELWAEITAGMMHEDSRKFLYENFPNTMKEYDSILDDILSAYK